MRRAAVYLRKKQFLIHSYSRTTDGVWMFAMPCMVLNEHCGDADLGIAIRKSLESSHVGVPHPKNWAGVLAPLLAAAEVKSWGTFSKSAHCIEVEEVGDRVSLTPTTNLGVDEGFQPRPSEASDLAGDAPMELGSEARRLLQLQAGTGSLS